MYKIIIEGETFEGNSAEIEGLVLRFVRTHLANSSQTIDIDIVDNDYFED